VSLGVVESAVISENHVYENGPRAIDPVCGVFIGYGDDLEITDNVLAANGTITTSATRAFVRVLNECLLAWPSDSQPPELLSCQYVLS